jgi:hypothetical protein
MDADREVAADLVLAWVRGRTAQEGGAVGELDRVDGSSKQVIVERSQIIGRVEDDVGGVLGLADAPVIAAERSEVGTKRATAASIRAWISVTARLSDRS